MAFTYNLATDTGMVRLLINDKYSADPIFQDEEINAFLTAEGASVKRGAALALETIARDEVYVQKVIKTLQLSTDGAKTSAEMRAHAKLLREQADNEIIDTEAAFEIAEFALSPFGTRERIEKQAMRGEL